jgi:hypothetical protein
VLLPLPSSPINTISRLRLRPLISWLDSFASFA